MNLNTFLAIAAVVYAAFGLGLLFTPELVATIFGTSLNAGGVQAARILGAALIGYTLICWWSREAAGGLQAVLRGNFVYNILGVLLALYVTTSGIWGQVGWVAVIIHLGLLIGFGYFAMGKR